MYGLVKDLVKQANTEKQASDLDIIDESTNQVKYANIGTADYGLYEIENGAIVNADSVVYETPEQNYFKQASLMVFEKIANDELEEEDKRQSALSKHLPKVLAALGIAGGIYGTAKGLSGVGNTGSGVPNQIQSNKNQVIDALRSGGAKVSGAMEAPFKAGYGKVKSLFPAKA